MLQKIRLSNVYKHEQSFISFCQMVDRSLIKYEPPVEIESKQTEQLLNDMLQLSNQFISQFQLSEHFPEHFPKQQISNNHNTINSNMISPTNRIGIFYKIKQLIKQIQRFQGKITKNYLISIFCKTNKLPFSVVFGLVQKYAAESIAFCSGLSVKRQQHSYLVFQILKIIESTPFADEQQIKQILFQKQQSLIQNQQIKANKIKSTTIASMLRNLGFRKKQLSFNLSIHELPFNRSEIYQQYNKLINIFCNQSNKIFYFDHFLIHQKLKKQKFWIRFGQDVPEKIEQLRRISFLLLMIIDQNNQIIYEAVPGVFNQIQYCKIISRLLKPISDSNIHNQNKLVIVYRDKDIFELVKSRAAVKNVETILFTQDSVISPLQSWFTQFKQILKNKKWVSEKQLVIGTKQSIEELKQKRNKQYVENCQELFYKKFNKQFIQS